MRACRQHPLEPAGWSCAGCRADLCADCVAKQIGGPKGRQIPICCACGRGVVPIMVHRRDAQPFARRLWRAFDFPLGSTGIISLFFVGFVRALTSYAGAGSMIMGAGAFALRQGLYWAFIFFIIRSVANSERKLGVFGFTDIHSDLIAPAVKGIFATAILWIPAVIYIYLAAGEGLAGILTYPSYRDPAVWLLALLGALYAPMALLAAATEMGFGSILNPIFIGQSIMRIGKDYFLAVVVVGMVLLLGGAAAALLGALFMMLPVPFVGRWLALTVGLYAPFVAAGILGHLLWVHGEVLDWGRNADYQTLFLPGVEPRGQVRPRPEQKLEPMPVRASRLAPAAPPGPGPLLEPSAPGPGMPISQESLLNLSSGLVAETPGETPVDLPKLDETPSILKFGIRIPSGILEAQAFVDADEPAPVEQPALDLTATPLAPPAEPAVPLAPPLPAPAPPKPAPSAPVTAFVEPRPGLLNLSAAPTMHGFSPSLPLPAEAPPTVIGHEAALPGSPPTTPGSPKGPSRG